MMGILWGNVEATSIKEVWNFCNETYKWNLPDIPEIPEDCYIDISQLKKGLRKHGLQSLATLIEAFDGSTGNVFYDYRSRNVDAHHDQRKGFDRLAHEDWLKVPKIRKQLDEAYDILETRSGCLPMYSWRHT